MRTKVWLYSDHLGRVSSATSNTAVVLSQQRYKPWSEVRGGTAPACSPTTLAPATAGPTRE